MAHRLTFSLKERLQELLQEQLQEQLQGQIRLQRNWCLREKLMRVTTLVVHQIEINCKYTCLSKWIRIKRVLQELATRRQNRQIRPHPQPIKQGLNGLKSLRSKSMKSIQNSMIYEPISIRKYAILKNKRMSIWSMMIREIVKTIMDDMRMSEMKITQSDGWKTKWQARVDENRF